MSGPPTSSPPDPTAPLGHVQPVAHQQPARTRRWRRAFLGCAILGALAAAIAFVTPVVRTALATVSTDDAYVNGHVTFVAPRVSGQVLRVYVDDNYRVRAGDVLLELDPEPYQVQVNIKRATLEAAEADRRSTESDVRGTLAQLRSQRWKLQTTMEQVDNQVALLKARVAAVRSAEASREQAELDLGRAKDSFAKGVSSKQDLDAAVARRKVTDAQVRQALEEVSEVRVALGLAVVPGGGDLTEVPENWNQRFSAVRQALADLNRIAAQLGLPINRSEATPSEVIAEFRKRDSQQDLDRIYEGLVPNAPAIKQADARVMQARRDLDHAELNLRYCRVVAEIDGVVTRRNVNPGNNVQAGQQVMAVRSLTEVWIDANFKETQLAALRIGHRVEVVSDIYGSHRVYCGRITGFTYGTGSTLALLPPQNATGNFVKVVQRLPVRIELDDYDPEADTLFAGLSVTPYVYVNEPPAGPNANRRLQDLARPGAAQGGKP